MRKGFRTIRINLLIFLAGFIIIDAVLGIFRIPYDYNSFREKHPYYHHGLRSNQSAITAWGGLVYRMYTNSLGFRDSAACKVDKTSDHTRILFMGDSHTEAVGVEFKYSFPGILQEKLLDRNIEVLNAAVVSYSPLIHYLKADYLINRTGLEVDEIWIFVDISDLQNEIAYQDFRPEEPGIFYWAGQAMKNFLKKRSFTFYTLNHRADNRKIYAFVDKMKQFDPRSITGLHRNTVELYYDFFRDFDNDDLLRSPEFHGVGQWYYDSATIDLADKGLELGMKNMERLSALCKENNIRLRLGVHPWQTQVMRQDTLDYYVSAWSSFCQQQNIDFINLFPCFINGENPYTATLKYYIPDDNHWNEEGHRLVADYLYKNCLK